MPSREVKNRTFDARPDRIDYRDVPYRPKLISLPDIFPDVDFILKHLSKYAATLILDQGREGACTGFGLSAVINYLLWMKKLEVEASFEMEDLSFELRREAIRKKNGQKLDDHESVSPRMLYHLARVYDEWQGEDYEGSSCRGAMKGWHRHGVCSESFWRYRSNGTFVRPKEGWQTDAALRPLGAYYRVNKDSIVDMQAAICEVGAIYVSAMVHEGWFLDEMPEMPDAVDELPTIELGPETGGHAFAIVGYTPQGFIVQNSWGRSWGFLGFGILPYADWVQHGTDAWVAVLGAPMTSAPASRTLSSVVLRDRADGKAQWFWTPDKATTRRRYENEAVEPWPESYAYEHTIVLGNDGVPLNRHLDMPDAAAAVREVVLRLPREWAGKLHSVPKVAIFAHGGLNDEATSIKRIRVMAPYFYENDIYPIFITWRTGVLETIQSMIRDAVRHLFAYDDSSARGLVGDFRNQIDEARDRAVEAAAANLLVKPMWAQMKQNAEAAAGAGGGLALLARHLTALKRDHRQLEIHLVGHSAGSLLLGQLLSTFTRRRVPVSTTTLYAPACSLAFALRHFVGAIKKRTLKRENLHVDLLSDERERADTVGPYGKSLLYLVSRALETVHKMPLLGMAAAWNEDDDTADLWNQQTRSDVAEWSRFARDHVSLRTHDEKRMTVFDGQQDIPLAHGSFDNDIEVVRDTLLRIRKRPLVADVENLHGF